MAKVTLNDLSKALGLNEKEPKKDFHYYGTIVSSNPTDRTYEVSINRDQNVSVEAARLVGAAVGDTVMVTVMANGYATVTGRLGGDLDATDAQRAADDAADAASSAMGTANTAMTNATEANRIANNAKTLAENAEAEAGRAKTAADNAVIEAARSASAAEESERQAKRSADAADASEASATQSAQAAANSQASALQSAQSAQESATSAANSAASASRSTVYANAALNQLGIVEDVVGTLDWITKHGTYTRTADTAVDSSKVYFVYDSSTGDYTPVIDPKDSELNTYYELDITESQGDFIMSHLAVTSRGLWVLPNGMGSASDPKDAPKYKALLAADGMWIYDDHGVMVAKYGDGISFDSTREYRIGDQNTYIRYVDSNNDGIADRIEIKAASISLGSTDLATKISNIEGQISSTDQDLANYITSQEDVIEDLQNQIDGAIDTWYYSGEPAMNKPPVANNPDSTQDWKTDETKENHLRDLYFDTATGHTYRFAKEGNTFKWVQIEDADAIKALADAAAAQGTANVKKRVFVAQPTPPYDIGDLWVQGSTGDIKRCSTAKTSSQSYAAADWVLASKYTDDTKANAVDGALTNFKSEFTVTPAEISSEVQATKNGETLVSRINQTADTVKIEAEHVEIDGTAAFNAIKSKADAAYDAKGAADAVQVGGRNLLKKSDVYRTNISGSSISGGTATTIIPSGETITLSVEVNIDDLVWDTSTGSHRIGVAAFIQRSDGTNQYLETWVTRGTGSAKTYTYIGDDTSFHGRISSVLVLGGDIPSAKGFGLYIQGVQSGTISVGRIKLEKGNKATDWTPAPEDVQSEIDAKKSTHTLSTTYSYTYAQLLTYSNEYTTAWTVSSTTDVSVGDTVRLKMTVSDMSNAPVYIVGTVTEIVNATRLKITSHGLDTTVIDGGNILTNSITANQIRGNTITLGQISTNVQNSILNENIEVGGRNLIFNTAEPQKGNIGSRTTITDDYATLAGSTADWGAMWGTTKMKPDLLDGATVYTVSFEYRSTAALSDTLLVISGSSETTGSSSWTRSKYANWKSSEALPSTGGEWVKHSLDPRTISLSQLTSGSGDVNSFFLQLYNRSNGVSMDVRHFKLERGNKATDWTLAPEDVYNTIDNVRSFASDAVEGVAKTADSALGQLGIVESAVDTLTWLTKYGTFEQTTDSSVRQDEVYYTRSGAGTEADPYTYEVVREPEEDPSTAGYYVLTSVKEGVSNYVASHLELTGKGLCLTNDDTAGKVILSDNGVELIDEHGNTVATYGTNTVIGDEEKIHLKIEPTELGFYDGDERVAYISNNELYIPRVVVVDSMQVGNRADGAWQWVVDDDSRNLRLMWIGG